MEPALALIVECCRADLGEAELDSLAAKLTKADGKRIAQLAKRHRVEGLVWRVMQRSGLIPLGAGTLAEQARRIAMDGLLMARESGRVHRNFAGNSLPHLFLKGQTLGALAWGNPMLKRQLDIDLLVPAGAIGRAAAILSHMGYVQETPEPSVDPADWHRRHKESLWRSDDGILLDLHSRLADNPAVLSTVTAASPARLVEIAGGVALPTLGDRLLLPYLAVHGCSSGWFRLKWIADFAALARRVDGAAIAAAIDIAPRLQAGRALAAAFVLANRLLGTPIPEELEYDGGAARLVKIGLKAIADEREPTDRALGTLSIHHSQMLMAPGSHFFVGEAMRQLGALLTR
ncbi:hypothetical protein GCM10022281_21700 [Sphingomonas rosea]|uniref:Nucleotidyltransferase family protein n=1 Tax=Sphingomonas rosea TaxID=335605 RepID=A0ABP7UCF7_9SPHN